MFSPPVYTTPMLQPLHVYNNVCVCLGKQAYLFQLLRVEYEDSHQAVAVGSFPMLGSSFSAAESLVCFSSCNQHQGLSLHIATASGSNHSNAGAI